MKIELKENWNQVTLSEYLEYDKIIKQDLASRPHHKQCLILSCISNATYEDIQKIPKSIYSQMVDKAMFLTVPPEMSVQDEFKINGVDYMVIDHNEMSVGESISMEQILIDEKETGVSGLAKILAIMIRPIVRSVHPEFKDKVISTPEDFDTDKLERRANLFLEKLTVPYLTGFLTASLAGEVPLEKTIKKSLEENQSTQ